MFPAWAGPSRINPLRRPLSALPTTSNSASTGSSAATSVELSDEEIRKLIQKVAENDIANDQKQRDYTYTEREEEHKVDGTGQTRSTESTTHEIMVL